MREDEEWSAAELDASQRAFDDALVAAAQTGHEVVVDTAAGQRRGRIVHLGEDLIGLVSIAGGRVDVVMDHVIGVVVSRRPGAAATVSTGHPRTLVARLRQGVQEQRPIIAERIDASSVRGVVAAVAVDHVVLRSREDDVLVPLAAIVAVADD